MITITYVVDDRYLGDDIAERMTYTITIDDGNEIYTDIRSDTPTIDPIVKVTLSAAGITERRRFQAPKNSPLIQRILQSPEFIREYDGYPESPEIAERMEELRTAAYNVLVEYDTGDHAFRTAMNSQLERMDAAIGMYTHPIPIEARVNDDNTDSFMYLATAFHQIMADLDWPHDELSVDEIVNYIVSGEM